MDLEVATDLINDDDLLWTSCKKQVCYLDIQRLFRDPIKFSKVQKGIVLWLFYLVSGAGFPYEKHGSTIVFPSWAQKLIAPFEVDPKNASNGATCLPPWYLSISDLNYNKLLFTRIIMAYMSITDILIWIDALSC